MQKVITDNNLWDFDKQIARWLNEGWKVVPTTLQIVASIDRERYIVVLEKN